MDKDYLYSDGAFAKFQKDIAESLKDRLQSNVNYNYPKLSTNPEYIQMVENATKSAQEKYDRDLENNENLKSIVQYNQEISNYNRELVTLTNKLLNKVNSLDGTLLLLNSSFNNSAEKTEEQLKQNNALMLQLVRLIEEKDEKKISDFMGSLTGTVGIELLVSYLKMKFGFTV